MSDSRLFTSSLSRRQLARRRPTRAGRAGRAARSARAARRQLALGLLVLAICLAAFAVGHHGL